MTYVEISFMTSLITQKKTDTHKTSLGLVVSQTQEIVYETEVKETVYEKNLNFRLPITNTYQKFLSARFSTEYCGFSSGQERILAPCAQTNPITMTSDLAMGFALATERW